MLLFFFLVINLQFLTAAVTTQISIPTAELAIPTGTKTTEANAEIETQPVTVEAKRSKSST